MSLGTLTLRTPDGRTRQFEVEQPTLGVGRAQDNQLVIDDGSIERRHARLTFEGGRMLVEDLGSANGSFIGGRRLDANTPSLAPEGQPVMIGDVELVYAPSPEAFRSATEAAAGAGPALPDRTGSPSGPAVEVSLDGPAQPVAPGSSTIATLTLRNRGATADEFTIHASGVPEDWVQPSQERVALLPGARESITVTFLAPRRAEVAAGDHAFTLSVVSRESLTEVNVQGVLRVLPFQGLALSLLPVRGSGVFQLSAQNEGNAPATCTLSGDDDEHSLRYEFDQPTLKLQPGQSAIVALRVAPKVMPRVGTREARPFNVIARPVDFPGAGETRASGQLIIRPPIPIWLIPAGILLALSVCVVGAYAFVRLCPVYGPNLPFCPASVRPVINVFTVTPVEVGPGGTVVIAWDVSNADIVQLLAPAQTTLPPSGVKAFQVEQDTTFTLHASNFAGSVVKSVSVIVRGTDIPTAGPSLIPTRTPTPSHSPIPPN